MFHLNLKIKRACFTKGFSLTELLITIALFLVLAGVGMGSYVEYYRTSQANQEIDSVLTLVKRTRSRAIKNASGLNQGVHFDAVSRELTTFEDNYVPGDPLNKSLQLNQLTIEQLNLQPNIGSTNEVVFEAKTGKTVNTGYVLFNSAVGEYRFEVNEQGLID